MDLPVLTAAMAAENSQPAELELLQTYALHPSKLRQNGLPGRTVVAAMMCAKQNVQTAYIG